MSDVKKVILILLALLMGSCDENSGNTQRPKEVYPTVQKKLKIVKKAANKKTESDKDFFEKRGFIKSDIWSIEDFKKACKKKVIKIPNPDYGNDRGSSAFSRYDYVCDDVRFVLYERNKDWKKDLMSHWRTAYTLKSVDPKTKKHEVGPLIHWYRKHLPHDGNTCKEGNFCRGNRFNEVLESN